MAMAVGTFCVPCLRMFKRRTPDFRPFSRVGLRLTPVSSSLWIERGERSYCTDKPTYIEDSTKQGAVSVEYIQGLPHLTVPLPSRKEVCRFALKPVSHNVGDLIEMLKTEDRGIDRAMILNNSGIRIASTCNIESILDESFWLFINDHKYKVQPPKRKKIPTETIDKLGDVRALVAQLYEALHVGEYHIKKEQELKKDLEDLKYRLAPLEAEKLALAQEADRRVTLFTWLGLGYMSVQFGVLARLTWWEYSWDIMEPVTYFVTYGTGMAMYAYYCITKTEYNYNEVKDRTFLLNLHKRAKKKNFNLEEYNVLKRRIAELEFDLRRLRDPINMQLPPHVIRAQQDEPEIRNEGEVRETSSSQDSSSVITNTSTTDKKTNIFRLPFFGAKK